MVCQKKITTVDKYQGQQNDFILLSLVKTKNIGHLRDVRRLIVAMSRARLGLYVFARCKLFKSCYELTPVFNILLKRPTKLEMILNELYPSKRDLNDEPPKETIKIVENMPEMAQLVYDFYQTKLKTWQKNKNQVDKLSKEERLKKLNEEEKLLREKLEETIDKHEQKHATRLNIGKTFEVHSSSSSSSDDEEEEESQNENEIIKSQQNVSQNENNMSREQNSEVDQSSSKSNNNDIS